jgi:hypothetical protein
MTIRGNRILGAALIAFSLFAYAADAKSKSSSDSSKTTSKAPAAKREVKVREYSRKDGTTAGAHKRGDPRPAAAKSSNGVARDSRGKVKRSETAKRDFQSSHPCPANGSKTGGCSGYVIDHVKPLACGGADEPANMQWQSAAEGKAKDATERTGCSK